MERIVQLLDELEDFVSLLRHQLGLFPSTLIEAARGTVPFSTTPSLTGRKTFR